ncbi:MAG: hypothetical protein O8C64_10305 [Candidatus Methanoperedens sp.]|nr:hypothetical protein [Candidatus Methanoperedens sp.]MCZ7403908.1 hypothetical protein [Candidatus Methanoperedens sp.]
MPLDFTLSKFRSLCLAVAQHYPTPTLAEYFQAKNLPPRFTMMRHDIDRKPENALFTARIEAESGIKATYYFRRYGSAFRPDIMKEIEGMGHEVGYHYEVFGKAKGNSEKAIKMFEHELEEFRKICDVRTISMHGNPMSKYDDRELWKAYDFRDFGIMGEAYLSAGEDVKYFSDTGRSWNSKNNMRDFMPGRREESTAETTDDMIEIIKSERFEKLYILTHPERWAAGGMGWAAGYMKDMVFNVGKRALIIWR